MPAFASNGKDVVTVEQVLMHLGGFPMAPLGPGRWDTRESRLESSMVTAQGSPHKGRGAVPSHPIRLRHTGGPQRAPFAGPTVAGGGRSSG